MSASDAYLAAIFDLKDAPGSWPDVRARMAPWLDEHLLIATHNYGIVLPLTLTHTVLYDAAEFQRYGAAGEGLAGAFFACAVETPLTGPAVAGSQQIVAVMQLEAAAQEASKEELDEIMRLLGNYLRDEMQGHGEGYEIAEVDVWNPYWVFGENMIKLQQP